jgi:thioredoxin 1
MIDLDPNNIDEALLKGTKHVLVYVTATWCGPCRFLRPIVEEFDRTLGSGALIVRIDADLCQSAVQALSVTSVPTLIAFEDGIEKGRHVGVLSAEQLSAMLGV